MRERRPTTAAVALSRKGSDVPRDTVRLAVSTDEERLALAMAHVRRVRQRCPWARAVDPDVHVGIVLAWLQPLPADRPFRRPAAPWRRGEPVWVGGVVGVHHSRAREAA